MNKIMIGLLMAFLVMGCSKKEEIKPDIVTEPLAMESESAPAAGHEHHHHEHHQMGEEAVKPEMSGVVFRKAKDTELDKPVTCPVMGTKFKVNKFTEVAEYKGKPYYFCCAQCPPEFNKNPDKYAK